MGNGFSIQQIPDLSGKKYVVTGANTGIGAITVRELARKGAFVVLACRSEEKAKAAIEKIATELGPDFDKAKLEFQVLDLMSLESAAKAARELRERHPKIDVLINNAGIMTCPYQLTKDGIESQFGTNHMGHFVFTGLLFPSIDRSTGDARVVNLSSLAHEYPYSWGISEYEQIVVGADGDESKLRDIYTPHGAYGQSKLANLLFTKKIAQRVPNVWAAALHPGYVATELQRNIGGAYGGVASAVMSAATVVFAKSPDNGARTTLAAATHPKGTKWDVASGSYFEPYGEVKSGSKMANDPALADKLWDLSIRIVKEKLGESVAAEIEKNIS
ncbi:hypothetical protein BC828DRAFT_397901 [Blastocladiella britannica]|nr:hypothetical protein BC828DRAFT_397901 [Blastocladiella britannica]